MTHSHEAAVLDCLRAMRKPGEGIDYEFAAELPLLHREGLDCGQQLGLSPGTLNLINAHVGDARLPESKRYGGPHRNVDYSATEKRSPANDRDHHATAIIEVDDADLRPHRQAAMRRGDALYCAGDSPPHAAGETRRRSVGKATCATRIRLALSGGVLVKGASLRPRYSGVLLRLHRVGCALCSRAACLDAHDRS
jgi:hypothetical protein